MTENLGDNIALSFNQVGVSSLYPPRPLLNSISGYVVKGGITAILGASASGKSVLMKVLAGRLPQFHVTGTITLDGVRIEPTERRNSIGYVPQDDFLMGEISARETLANVLYMKEGKTADGAAGEVQEVLKTFGLDHVADTIIGTVFVRGLSGGQRKRVEVCSELISPPTVLLLDEPTSGLDGAIAYEVINAIKELLKRKKGEVSVIMSIHQPNSRILELFDHILLLSGEQAGATGSKAGGGMLFFGTVPESIEHFTSIGFPPPSTYTPTDVFLQVTDANFGTHREIDFEGTYACSPYFKRLHHLLREVERSGMYRALKRRTAASSTHSDEGDEETGKGGDWKVVKVQPLRPADSVEDEDVKPVVTESTAPSVYTLYRQYVTLLWREFTLAWRDPSLYYLQVVLVIAFGFLVGAAFFQLRFNINSKMNYVSSGLLWIVMMCCYIQVFKVYHLSVANKRLKHEINNNTYDPIIYWFAELTATMILLISFIPGTAIAYFMMGLPSKAYPFALFLYWMCAVTAESMLHLLTKFSEDATVAIVVSQAVLVILTVFGGGMFIAWNRCPDYWKWLQELSVFTQASRSVIMAVNDYIDYKCSVAGDGNCYGPLGDLFPCDASPADANGVCKVSGREVLYVLQGTAKDESKWIPFGYLVLIFAVCRLASLFLMYYPVQRIMYVIQDFFSGISSRGILDNQIGLRRVEGQMNSFLASHHINQLKSKEDSKLDSVDEEEQMLDRHGSNPALIRQESLTTSKRISELVLTNCSKESIVRHFRLNREGSCLRWKNLSVKLKKDKKVLINSVSGVALPGRILALMGPSGAGKTTLLNALGNRAPYAFLTGEVTFGKRAFTAEDLVYVPQFDEFNMNMTVFETMEFVGQMKCADRQEMLQRLASLLIILGLADKAHYSCRRLTSGELKRVSVGMGMIANPNVLFLDEPTTGLDSTAAYSIVKYLSDLSRDTNVVVIMTIHQPAQIVFDMLQDLYLLEKAGLAYFGPSHATQAYFSQFELICPNGISAVDFYLDLVNDHPPPALNTATWSELYDKSSLGANAKLMMDVAEDFSASARQPPAPPSYWKRFFFQLQFFIRYYLRDPGFYYLRNAQLILIALFLGTLFLQETNWTDRLQQYSGALFFSIWTVLFSSVAATGLLASDRRQAIEQVKNAVIVPSAYCLAQFTVSLPFNFLSALAFESVFHWLTNINPHGEAFVFAIFVTTGHLLLMEAIMLSVVQALKNAMLSVTFAMVVMGYLFLFSGFFILISDMPPWINWISYITPTMYSFRGYLWQIYQNQDFFINGSNGGVMKGTDILDQLFDIREINSWGMFGALIGW
eukprot:CAMPEP_0173133204 /NCGR_PEP_ID=MMETSP1105-20130129/595_1 /TAXON_ID=2985 /ORGANISM="Ochromonas sp., Strain BG-1" /LENGTH=1323 /DNA_ID=CAMNT_0014044843 /DNA_START=330 /DNA_END=4298 /DNA_ORIENTATION=+